MKVSITPQAARDMLEHSKRLREQHKVDKAHYEELKKCANPKPPMDVETLLYNVQAMQQYVFYMMRRVALLEEGIREVMGFQEDLPPKDIFLPEDAFIQDHVDYILETDKLDS